MNTRESAVERLLQEESGHRPRADAQRNVHRLITAAREAVAEIGVEVTAHEIARRAGVGIGTFYRRLPSREALLEAVLADTINEIVSLAHAALEDPDPWRGFCEFAAEFAHLRAASCGINEVLGCDSGLDLEPSLTDLREQVRRMVERAQQAGSMRTDIHWQDIPFLLAATVTSDHTIGLAADDQQWQCNLRIILDGLRAGVTDM